MGTDSNPFSGVDSDYGLVVSTDQGPSLLGGEVIVGITVFKFSDFADARAFDAFVTSLNASQSYLDGKNNDVDYLSSQALVPSPTAGAYGATVDFTPTAPATALDLTAAHVVIGGTPSAETLTIEAGVTFSDGSVIAPVALQTTYAAAGTTKFNPLDLSAEAITVFKVSGKKPVRFTLGAKSSKGSTTATVTVKLVGRAY